MKNQQGSSARGVTRPPRAGPPCPALFFRPRRRRPWCGGLAAQDAVPRARGPTALEERPAAAGPPQCQALYRGSGTTAGDGRDPAPTARRTRQRGAPASWRLRRPCLARHQKRRRRRPRASPFPSSQPLPHPVLRNRATHPPFWSDEGSRATKSARPFLQRRIRSRT